MGRRIKANWLIILLLCTAIRSISQDSTYLWQSSLVGVHGEGYYKLLLSPEVRALATSDGADFRIVDSTGNYVPYLLGSETPVQQVEDLIMLPIEASTDSTSEYIIIENNHSMQLSELVLTLRNKAQGTEAQLSGSDDGAKWFDISTDIFLSPSSQVRADTFDQQISFPPVKYKKLRLVAKKHKSIPLYVIKAAMRVPVVTSGKYSAVPSPIITQRDSAKKTYVTLDYKESYTVEKLLLTISGPRFYHRQCDIYERDTAAWKYIGNGILSSGGTNELSLTTRTKHLQIVINNEDNKPLQIESADGLQLNNYLLSYLDGDRNYYLVFGNKKAEKPNYDITYFEDSIKKNTLLQTTCGPIGNNRIIPNTEPVKKATSKSINKWWIWPLLISILALLLYFTLNISRDIGRKP